MTTNPQAKTILCYGDSNTWGQTPDIKARYPVNVRWTGLLQHALGDGFTIIEEGLSSRTTDLDYPDKPGLNGRTYLGPCLDSQKPLDLVIIMLGTNDLKVVFNRPVQHIAQAVQNLVELIRQKTKAQVIVLSPAHIKETPHFTKFYTKHYDHDSIEKSYLLAPALQEVAEKTGSWFVDAAEVAEAGQDGVHLSAQAHKALARRLAQEIKKLYSKTK